MAHYLKLRGFERRGFRVDNDSRVNYATTAEIDLDDQKQTRILKMHRHQYFTSPEFSLMVGKTGGAATGAVGQIVVPRDMVLKSVVTTLGVEPAGSDFIVDVHRVAAGGLSTDAGTTVFTTQSRRPTIIDDVTAVNEIQTIDNTGTVSGGNYTITFDGQTTTALNHNANVAAIQAALDALSNVAPGDIVVGGGDLPTTPVTLTFEQAYAGTDVPLATVDSTNLTGGGTYDIVETTPGVSAVAGSGVSTLDATNGVPQVSAMSAGDILRVEVDQVGSGTAGSNLLVQLNFGLV
jgi:hypothetical protein